MLKHIVIICDDRFDVLFRLIVVLVHKVSINSLSLCLLIHHCHVALEFFVHLSLVNCKSSFRLVFFFHIDLRLSHVFMYNWILFVVINELLC